MCLPPSENTAKVSNINNIDKKVTNNFDSIFLSNLLSDTEIKPYSYTYIKIQIKYLETTCVLHLLSYLDFTPPTPYNMG